MVGKKGNIFNIMNFKLVKRYSFLLSLILTILASCKQNSKDGALEVQLIPRNSYFVDTYNGVEVYRYNDTKKVMAGYYIVGDKATKWEEFNIEDGVLNGEYIVFHPNGNIFSNSQYVKGKLNGEERIYSLSGHLKTLKTYKNGVLYGKSLGYFENGQVRSESTINKEKVIESVTFNQIGEINSQMFIKDGIKITQTIKGGKVNSEQFSSTYDTFEAMKFYNDDGSLQVYLKMENDDENSYLIELNENGDEIKRINVKANPKEAMKYFQYMESF